MKLTTLVLLCSLALNAILAVGFVRPARDTSGERAASESTVPARPSTAFAPAAAKPRDLPTLSPVELRTELLRLKFSREVIDALVTARIYAPHDEHRAQLMRETSRLPWWQTVTARPDRLNLLTAEQRKELRHLDAAARSEVVRLLGPEALDRDGAIKARYSYVPPERAVFLDAIVRDYQDIYAMLREDMHGLRTAVDREHENFVETERQRDLTKLLPAVEREIFELRVSPAANSMVNRLPAFEPSEEEYRALFAVHRDFHERNPGGVTVDGQARTNFIGDYPEYDQKIREALGEARYADWELAGNSYTLALTRIAPELGLSGTTVREAAMVLRDTAKRSWEIGEDTSTTTEQKRAALKDLVATTRRTFSSKLGENAGVALAQSAPWLEMIDGGYAVRADRGTSWTLVENVVRTYRPPTR